MKKWLMAVVFGSVLVLGACGGGGDEGADDGGNGGETASSGEEIYQNNCSACHVMTLAEKMDQDLTVVVLNYPLIESLIIIIKGKVEWPVQHKYPKKM